MTHVTVVVPFFNKVALTLACVRSLERARAFNLVPFDVVLVDDASTEDTSALHATSARMFRNDSNQGYLLSTNRGAAEAVGEYVMLLNNDTEVVGAFLDPLVDLLQRRPRAAMVGPRLLSPGGLLQEVGSLVWSDGTGANLGRGHDPGHPFFAFERPTQYCSAAALLIRREFWDAVGGFDTRFTPAYYEDTDLAMVAWSRGREVWVQPASSVIHHEGASHGVDLTVGVKRYQEVNRGRFLEKWSDALRVLPPPHTPSVLPHRSTARRGHIVVVDHEVPTPDHDSGSLRMVCLMEIMLELGFSVTFCAHNGRVERAGLAALGRLGVEVWGSPESWQDHLAAMAPVTSFVWLARPAVADRWMPLMREVMPRTPIVFDTVDLHSVRQARQRDVLGTASVSADETVTEAAELALALQADVVVAVSEPEQAFLRERGVRSVCVIPNVHRIRDVRPRRVGRAMEALFVGGFRHVPNGDAVEWFVREVFPLVRASLPNFVLRVIGSHLSDELRSRVEQAGVVVEGFVPVLDTAYQRAGVVIAPLRFGAGVKGKVGEAMSHGVPVVLTTVAAEGFGEFRGGLIADHAPAFAEAIVRLLTDDSLWSECSRAALEDIAALMSPEVVRDRLEREVLPLVNSAARGS